MATRWLYRLGEGRLPASSISVLSLAVYHEDKTHPIAPSEKDPRGLEGSICWAISRVLSSFGSPSPVCLE